MDEPTLDSVMRSYREHEARYMRHYREDEETIRKLKDGPTCGQPETKKEIGRLRGRQGVATSFLDSIRRFGRDSGLQELVDASRLDNRADV